MRTAVKIDKNALLGRLILSKMALYDLNADFMAHRLGISRATFYNLIKHPENIKQGTLRKIFELIAATPEEILGVMKY